MSAADYFAQNDFLSRSYLHSVARFGGEAQRWMDSGYSLFSGNSATKLGSKFDALVMGICEGKQLGDMLQVPPPDVLASNGSRRGKAYDEWKAKAEGYNAEREARLAAEAKISELEARQQSPAAGRDTADDFDLARARAVRAGRSRALRHPPHLRRRPQPGGRAVLQQGPRGGAAAGDAGRGIEHARYRRVSGRTGLACKPAAPYG